MFNTFKKKVMIILVKQAGKTQATSFIAVTVQLIWPTLFAKGGGTDAVLSSATAVGRADTCTTTLQRMLSETLIVKLT